MGLLYDIFLLETATITKPTTAATIRQTETRKINKTKMFFGESSMEIHFLSKQSSLFVFCTWRVGFFVEFDDFLYPSSKIRWIAIAFEIWKLINGSRKRINMMSCTVYDTYYTLSFYNFIHPRHEHNIHTLPMFLIYISSSVDSYLFHSYLTQQLTVWLLRRYYRTRIIQRQ